MPTEERPCERCKQTFMQAKPKQRFCSTRCRMAAHRKTKPRKSRAMTPAQRERHKWRHAPLSGVIPPKPPQPTILEQVIAQAYAEQAAPRAAEQTFDEEDYAPDM